MNNIESRLRALERHTYRGKLSPGVSIIFPTESGWALSFSLWDGVTGNGRKTESAHNSEAEAHGEYDRLLKRYHSNAAAHLIVIDI